MSISNYNLSSSSTFHPTKKKGPRTCRGPLFDSLMNCSPSAERLDFGHGRLAEGNHVRKGTGNTAEVGLQQHVGEEDVEVLAAPAGHIGRPGQVFQRERNLEVDPLSEQLLVLVAKPGDLHDGLLFVHLDFEKARATQVITDTSATGNFVSLLLRRQENLCHQRPIDGVRHTCTSVAGWINPIPAAYSYFVCGFVHGLAPFLPVRLSSAFTIQKFIDFAYYFVYPYRTTGFVISPNAFLCSLKSGSISPTAFQKSFEWLKCFKWHSSCTMR